MIQRQLRGGPETLAFLDQLPARLQRNILRGAVRAGCRVFADDIKLRSTGLRTPAKKVDGTVVVPSQPIGDAVKVYSRADQAGGVRGKVYIDGFAGAVALWGEYGTRAHFIRVRAEARPTTTTRRGVRTWGLRTINTALHRGSLTIAGNFVGQAVMHPGARARPIWRPAFDESADDAISAFGGYIASRLRADGLNVPDNVAIEVDQ